MKLDLQAYLFTPAEAVAWRNERQREKREKRTKAPRTPSQQARAAKAKPRKLSPTYNKNSYARAIARACKANSLPAWHPHQLRHTAGTAYRREGDFEAAKIVLGHRSDSMTQNYAERDARKAEEIVSRIG